MPELDPDLARAIAALRSHRGPPTEAKARVHARLEAALIGPGGPDGDSGLGHAEHVGTTGLFAAKVVGATTALTAAGLLVLKLGAIALAPSPAPREPPAAAEPTAPTSVEPITSAPTEHDPPPDADSPTDTPQPVASKPRPSGSSEPITAPAEAELEAEPEAELAAELALIDAARRAKTPDATIAQLREHARRFPSGSLRDEREALWAIASCAGKDFADARARRDAILARRPSSPLLDRIANACPDLDP